MGWTSTNSYYFKQKGRKRIVDAKAECDSYWQRGPYKLIKSTMKSSTYYAAVQRTDTGVVFAAVFLTSTKRSPGYNFSYKPMTEGEGPSARECPAHILDLLTPTTNNYAVEWREDCRKYARKQRENARKLELLRALPAGCQITFKCPMGLPKVCLNQGDPVVVEKFCMHRNIFVLMFDGRRIKWPLNLIPKDFEVVSCS